jgi:hypothetical protein
VYYGDGGGGGTIARRAGCPVCNSTNGRDAPRLPEGFKTEVDKDGWRH